MQKVKKIKRTTDLSKIGTSPGLFGSALVLPVVLLDVVLHAAALRIETFPGEINEGGGI
jgi:hypothetical protein